MEPDRIEALARRYSQPPQQHHRSGTPLAEVVYADPGNNGWYYREEKPDSVAAYVRTDKVSDAVRIEAHTQLALGEHYAAAVLGRLADALARLDAGTGGRG